VLSGQLGNVTILHVFSCPKEKLQEKFISVISNRKVIMVVEQKSPSSFV